MKMPALLKRKKLHAATARRPRGLGLPGLEYEQMAEPNMKLSRALLIVLLLHIVAVAGIVAFNTIKTRETVNAGPAEVASAAPAAVSPGAEPAVPAAPAVAAPNDTAPVVARTETKAPAREKEPARPSAAKKSDIADSGKIYTVVRGDNPVTIARHLKVAEADLLELNEITDPRKLQIGQKLRIPAETIAMKHKASD